MKMNSSFFSVVWGIFLAAAWSARAFQEPAGKPFPDFDRRPRAEMPAAKSGVQPAASTGLLGNKHSALRVDYDAVLGTPKWVVPPPESPTVPGGKSSAISPLALDAIPANTPHRITRAFLLQHRDLFGYGPEVLDTTRVRRESVARHSGMRTVVWEQYLDNIPVFEGVLIAHQTRDDRLISVSSYLMAHPAQAADRGHANRQAFQAAPTISARRALQLAAANLQENLVEAELQEQNPGPEKAGKVQRFQGGQLKGEAEVRQTWLPLDKHTLRLSWDVVMASRRRNEMYRLVVDAETGEVLLRRCLTVYLSDATYRVFTSDSPSPFSPGHPTPSTNQPPLVARSLITWPALNTNASPNGWIDDGDNETRGNNVDAHLDLNDDNQPDLPRPQGSPPRVFDFPMDLTQAPSTYREASVVQLFYWCNWMHDKLYELGFDEAAGNFQNNNFGRGGQDSDALMADAQDGGDFNNANMYTPSDGNQPRMQMYLFNGPNPDRDGDLDAEVVLHEYTHGLSNRRVGGGVGISASQSRGMGEGWSDFYCLALLSEPGEDLDGNFGQGAYVSYLLSGEQENYYYGIRRYPYTTDLNRNPLTFKDLDPNQADPHTNATLNPRHRPFDRNDANEVHRQGEVWCVTLWDARVNLIRQHGFTNGNQLILQLVTDGMTLSPPNPTFLQARDAILQADLVNTGGANQDELWAAFAKRGMGFSATSPDSSTTVGVEEAFDVPDDLQILPASGFTSRGEVGGPFTVTTQTYSLTNLGSNTLTWTAVHTSLWLNVSPASGNLTPGGPATTVTVTLDPIASSLAQAVYRDVVWFTNHTSGIGQRRQFALRIGQPDHFTELFSGDNDTDFQTFTFTPDGSPSFYRVCREVATNFLTDPAGGTTVGLGDDDSARITLADTNAVSLYGERTNIFYIGSNGYLTWGTGDSDLSESFADHFDLPRISALFDDLDPSSGGTVSWKALSNRVAVTFQDVPEFGDSSRLNSFQIELFYDETIRLTFLDIAATDGLVGLSQGLDEPPDFEESDFGAYPLCALPMRVTLPASAPEEAGVLAGQGEVELSEPADSDLVVNLSSSDTNELLVPPTVVVAAGQTNAAFDLTVVDDGDLDGTQRPVVTATLTNYATAVAVMDIFDNETTTLSVSLAANATEGDPGVTGIVFTADAPVANVGIRLQTDDASEILPPESVVLPAGQTSAVFHVLIVDDREIDGPQTATLTAQVQNWTSGAAAIDILDNEPVELMVQLPPMVLETDGTRTNAGSVELSGTLPTNLVVTLTSDNTNELTVPPIATILAGDFSAAFDLTIIDDLIVDSNQVVRVTGQAPGFGDGTGELIVLDDESPPIPWLPNPPHLAADVPADSDLSWRATAGDTIANGDFETGDFVHWTKVNSGNGDFVINDGTVIPTGPDDALPPYEGSFSILSQQGGPGRHTVYQDVAVPAGGTPRLEWAQRLRNHASVFSSEQYFRVEIRETNNAVLATAYTTQSGDPPLTDWTLQSFDLSPYGGTSIRLAFIEEDNLGYFNVHLDAIRLTGAVSGGTITNDVYFGTNPTPGAAELLGRTTNSTWELPRLAPATTYYWQIVAHRIGITAGPVWQFTTKGVDHFVWDPVPSPQTVGGPFPVALTAFDEFDRVVSNFVGTASLAGFGQGDGSTATIVIAEVNTDDSDSVEFINVSVSPVNLSGWQIVVYDSGNWPAPQSTFTIPAGTICEPAELFLLHEDGTAPGTFPVFYTGENIGWNNNESNNEVAMLLLDDQGSIVDFVCAVDADPAQISSPVSIPVEQWDGNPIPANSDETLTYQRVGHSDQNTNADWVVSTRSLGQLNANMTVPFSGGSVPVAVNPTNTTAFANGRWSGQVAVLDLATNVVLQAEDDAGHRGRSNPFDMAVTNDLSISLVTVPDPTVEGGTVTNHISVYNSGPADATEVQVTNFLSATLSVMAVQTSQGSCQSTNGMVWCDLGLMTNGMRASIEVVSRATAIGDVTNEVVVARAEADGYPDNNTASTVTTVVTPALSINDVAVFEGDTGRTNLIFTVALTPPAVQPVSVNFATSDGSAQAGDDYVATNGLLEFAPGQTNLLLGVDVLGDTNGEPNETFRVRLSDATNALINTVEGTGTILNDDLAVATMPFTEDWETNGFRPYWTVTGTGNFRSQVTTANGPHGGTNHLTMDSTSGNARNEVTLTIDLADWTNVVLRFFAREWSDESHGPPASPFMGGADFDGIAISTDSNAWYEVRGLRDLGSTYQQYSVELDTALRAHNLSYTRFFYLRFNQYDNSSIAGDGIGIDDIEINGRLLDDLRVQPEAGLVSSGYVIGPFVPDHQDYTLANTGGSNLLWSAGADQDWVTLFPLGGGLPAGGTTNLSVGISDLATNLAPGVHAATVSLTNALSGIVQMRQVQLTLNELPPAPVAPFNPRPTNGATTLSVLTQLSWNASNAPLNVLPPAYGRDGAARPAYGRASRDGVASPGYTVQPATTPPAGATTRLLLPNAIHINFDETNAPCNFSETTPLRDAYLGQGVRFEGPDATGGGAVLDQCGSFSVTGHSAPNFLAFSSNGQMANGGMAQGPQTIWFVNEVSQVEALVGSSSGSGSLVILEAYAANDALVDSAVTILSSTLQPIAVSGPGIQRVVVSSPASVWVLDDLSIVPAEPTSLEDYYVYLGTDTNALALTGVQLTQPRFDPGPLAFNTTYYWQVTASNVTGMATGPVWRFTTAQDEVQFAAASYRVDEDAALATITVIRLNTNLGPTQVQFATTNGTAVAGVDYWPTNGTLVFDTGVATQTFAVPILADAEFEGDETILLGLSQPSANVAIGADNPITLTIIDDDGQPVSLPRDLYDGEGYRWDVQTDGRIGDGSNDAYDGGLDLSNFPAFNNALLVNSNELIIGPADWDGLEVTRRVYVPTNHAYARFLEVLRNPGAVPITTNVAIQSNLGSDSSTRVIGTSSGDVTFTPDDDWIVTDDSGDGSGDPTMLHVIANPYGTLRPAVVSQSSDSLRYEYQITVPPGETVIIMHVAAQNPNQAAALAKGPQLTELGLDLMAGLRLTDLERIVNFGLPDVLRLSPLGGFAATGELGGPFTATNQTYQLENTGTSNITWTARCTQPWIEALPANGQLLPAGTISLLVQLTAAAYTLPLGHHTSQLVLSNENTGIVQQRDLSLVVWAPPTLPFVENWESGVFQPYWTVTGTGNFRSQIATGNGPYAGSYHLTMDSTSGSARNEVTLTLATANWTNLVLTYYAREWGDEPNGPPPTPFIGGFDFDGVAISVDSNAWYEVRDLRTLNSTYESYSVNLDDTLQAHGLSYPVFLYLRFNQFDDSAITVDGIGIDDIRITGRQLDDLVISPATGLAAAGVAGGPFAPSSLTYTLTNTGASRLNWTANTTANWVTAQPAGGSLNTNDSTTVTVLITTNATALPLGRHAAMVQFLNTISGIDQTRGVSLDIGEPPTPPRNPRPLDLATTVPVNPRLSWNQPTSGTPNPAVLESALTGSPELRVLPNADAFNVLLFDSAKPSNRTFAQDALNNLGLNFVDVAGDQTAFDIQMDSHAWDLVIYDMSSGIINASSMSRITDYVAAGGKVLMFWWDMDSDPAFAAIFGAGVVISFNTPRTVYGAAPLHPVWTTPEQVPLPLDDVSDVMGDDGDVLRLVGDGVVLGSFSSSGLPGNDAMILANDGHTIIHGFSPDENGYLDADSDGKIDRVELYENEIVFLLEGALGETYEVYFGTSPTPTNRVASGLTEPEFDPGWLAFNTEYYWQVIASNKFAATPGPVWSFTTARDQIQFSSAMYTVAEDQPAALITVNRLNTNAGLSIVAFATTNGTATSGTDYFATNRVLPFFPGLEQHTVVVPILDDEDSEGNETVLLALRNPSLGVAIGQPNPAELTITDDDLPVAPMPFTEDWETNTFAPYWRVTGTGNFRSQITAANGPHGGARHLTMDSSSGDARNEVTLTLDLASWTNVVLTFYAREWGDEAHGPPPIPFIGGYDFDGVAISTDSNAWYEVQSLRSLTSTYQLFTVDLDTALALHGLSYTPLFYLRFNQYDNSPISTDGIGIDDIAIQGTHLDDLRVTPATGLVASGYETGPFNPSNQVYTLTNTGPDDVPWNAMPTAPWLTATPASGALPPGTATEVTVAINDLARTLAEGNYAAQVIFTNRVSGASLPRDAQLTVRALLDHFEWQPIPSPQMVSQPFDVTITAVDVFQGVATNFNGPVRLAAYTGAPPRAGFQDGFEDGNFDGWTVDWGTYVRAVTNETAAEGAYSLTLIGGNGFYNGLSRAFTNTVPRAVQFHIRTRAGDRNAGYTVLGQGANNAEAAAFFFLSNTRQMGLFEDQQGGHMASYTPEQWYKITLHLDWNQRVIDYYVDDVLIEAGIPFRGATVTNISRMYLFNYQNTQTWWDDIQFLDSDSAASVAITPTNTGNFVNGVWTGAMQVLEPATNLYLVADDGAQRVGQSNPFDALLNDDLTVRITDAPDPVTVLGRLTNLITVANSGPSAATGVTLTNRLPAGITISDITPSQGSCRHTNDTVICDLGTVAGGAIATVTIVSLPATPGLITNTVTIHRAEPDTVLDNNQAAAVTTVRMPALTIHHATAIEGQAGATDLRFQVQLNPPAFAPVTVNYATSNNTAQAGRDYAATAGQLGFAPGETNLTITVPILGDLEPELDETFFVDLAGATNAVIAFSRGVGTILDDDQANVLYLRSTVGEPWGSTDNPALMDRVFGTNNWRSLHYETAAPETVFALSNRFIFMTGSDDNAEELEAFVTAHQAALENWVAAGGHLFINAAPNEGNGMPLGFGVNLTYPDTTDEGVSAFPTHPIFQGPFLPVGATWTGNRFAHATITGSGLTPLITNSANGRIVLGEKDHGAGWVLFGGMTLHHFHSPQPEAENLKANILAYGVATLLREPLLTIGDATVEEGDTGTTNLALEVRLHPPTNAPVTVSFQSANGTALAGTDYQPQEGRLTFAPNQTSQSLLIAIVGDTNPEPAETFFVRLTNAVNARLGKAEGVITILDDDLTGFFDDFDPDLDLTQWLDFCGGSVGTSVLATNYGGSVSPPNSLWFGGGSQRCATTQPVDTRAGGEVQFHLHLADGTDFPWEKVDRFPDEGVVLEYSVNGGTTWFEMTNCASVSFYNWTQVTLPLPLTAQTSATQFRWRQQSHSGANYDHWALDNVAINASCTPPAIVMQPVDQAVPEQMTVTFHVEAAGSGPLQFEWRHNGLAMTNEARISGTTSNRLTITLAEPSDNGSYEVVVSNGCGAVASSVATLEVRQPNGGPVTFGNFPLLFPDGIDRLVYDVDGLTGITNTDYVAQLWEQVGTVLGPVGSPMNFIGPPLPGAWIFETRTLYAPRGTPTTLQVRVWNGALFANWDEANAGGGMVGQSVPFAYTPPAATTPPPVDFLMLELRSFALQPAITNNPPFIVIPPPNRTVDMGQLATLCVLAGGDTPLAYQWRFHGTNLVDGGRISGTTDSCLTITNAQPADAGLYDVVVSNPWGSVVSSNALLTVNVPQPAQVHFSNFPFEFADGIDRLVYDVDGVTPLADSNYVAQLWEEVGGNFVSVGQPEHFLGPGLPGTWMFGQRTLNVPQGTPTTLQVRVWDASLYASWPEAVAAGGIRGASAPFSYMLVISPLPPSPNALLMTALRAFALEAPTPTTLVRAVGVTNVCGSSATIDIPIELIGAGVENALGFSLSYDTNRLAFVPPVALGRDAAGATLLVNTNTAAGRLGFVLSLDVGVPFARGTNELAVVSFVPVTATIDVPTGIILTNQPIPLEVVDTNAMVVAAQWQSATVSACGGNEGDVAPRPDGDGQVSTVDWVQAGRFTALWDIPTPGCEFQKVDTAPRPCGNGLITVADWVQAGRYAALLDPPVAACGPCEPAGALEAHPWSNGPGAKQQPSGFAAGAGRLMRVTDGMVIAGTTNVVAIELEAVGNETALGFSLNFDPALLRLIGVSQGSDAAGAMLFPNQNAADQGYVGVVLSLNPGTVFAPGTREVVRLQFAAVQPVNCTNTTIRFCDQPILREISDPAAHSLAAAEINGTVALGANAAPVFEPLAIPTASVGVVFSLTNRATDADGPGQFLSYRLDQAPAGSVLLTNVGTLFWVPDRSQAGTTHTFALSVTDQGCPRRSASRTFSVQVNDCATVSLGSATVRAGQTGSIAVNLSSSTEIGSVVVDLTIPEGCLTNLALLDWGTNVASADLEQLSATSYRLTFAHGARPPWLGAQRLAQLQFTARAVCSTLVTVRPDRVEVPDWTGLPPLDTRATAGQIAIVMDQPRLEAILTPAGRKQLVLYGVPGVTYELQYLNGHDLNGAWTVAGQVTLTNLSEIIPDPQPEAPIQFFRVRVQ